MYGIFIPLPSQVMIGPSKPTQQCLQSPYLRRHSGPYIDTRDELTPALHGSKSLVRVVLILHTSPTGAGIHMDPALKTTQGPGWTRAFWWGGSLKCWEIVPLLKCLLCFKNYVQPLKRKTRTRTNPPRHHGQGAVFVGRQRRRRTEAQV